MAGATGCRSASVVPTEHASLAMLPRISGVAVSEADTTLSQRDVLALLDLEGDEFAEGVFDRAAVTTRTLGLSPAKLGRTLQGRTASTEDQLFDHSLDLVGSLRVDPAEIGTGGDGEPVLARRTDARAPSC
jgi:hypothetical protein